MIFHRERETAPRNTELEVTGQMTVKIEAVVGMLHRSPIERTDLNGDCLVQAVVSYSHVLHVRQEPLTVPICLVGPSVSTLNHQPTSSGSG